MAFEMNDLKGIFFLMLLKVLSTTSTNIDCNGKAFHCADATHFMVCVDLGGTGVSMTIDDFIITCPQGTVCERSNQYECEYPVTTTHYPLHVIGVTKLDITQTILDGITKTIPENGSTNEEVTTLSNTKILESVTPPMNLNIDSKLEITTINYYTSNTNYDTDDIIADVKVKSNTHESMSSQKSNIFNKESTVESTLDKPLNAVLLKGTFNFNDSMNEIDNKTNILYKLLMSNNVTLKDGHYINKSRDIEENRDLEIEFRSNITENHTNPTQLSNDTSAKEIKIPTSKHEYKKYAFNASTFNSEISFEQSFLSTASAIIITTLIPDYQTNTINKTSTETTVDTIATTESYLTLYTEPTYNQDIHIDDMEVLVSDNNNAKFNNTTVQNITENRLSSGINESVVPEFATDKSPLSTQSERFAFNSNMESVEGQSRFTVNDVIINLLKTSHTPITDILDVNETKIQNESSNNKSELLITTTETPITDLVTEPSNRVLITEPTDQVNTEIVFIQEAHSQNATDVLISHTDYIAFSNDHYLNSEDTLLLTTNSIASTEITTEKTPVLISTDSIIISTEDRSVKSDEEMVIPSIIDVISDQLKITSFTNDYYASKMTKGIDQESEITKEIHSTDFLSNDTVNTLPTDTLQNIYGNNRLIQSVNNSSINNISVELFQQKTDKFQSNVTELKSEGYNVSFISTNGHFHFTYIQNGTNNDTNVIITNTTLEVPITVALGIYSSNINESKVIDLNEQTKETTTMSSITHDMLSTDLIKTFSLDNIHDYQNKSMIPDAINQTDLGNFNDVFIHTNEKVHLLPLTTNYAAVTEKTTELVNANTLANIHLNSTNIIPEPDHILIDTTNTAKETVTTSISQHVNDTSTRKTIVTENKYNLANSSIPAVNKKANLQNKYYLENINTSSETTTHNEIGMDHVSEIIKSSGLQGLNHFNNSQNIVNETNISPMFNSNKISELTADDSMTEKRKEFIEFQSTTETIFTNMITLADEVLVKSNPSISNTYKNDTHDPVGQELSKLYRYTENNTQTLSNSDIISDSRGEISMTSNESVYTDLVSSSSINLPKSNQPQFDITTSKPDNISSMLTINSAGIPALFRKNHTSTPKSINNKSNESANNPEFDKYLSFFTNQLPVNETSNTQPSVIFANDKPKIYDVTQNEVVNTSLVFYASFENSTYNFLLNKDTINKMKLSQNIINELPSNINTTNNVTNKKTPNHSTISSDITSETIFSASKDKTIIAHSDDKNYTISNKINSVHDVSKEYHLNERVNKSAVNNISTQMTEPPILGVQINIVNSKSLTNDQYESMPTLTTEMNEIMSNGSQSFTILYTNTTDGIRTITPQFLSITKNISMEKNISQVDFYGESLTMYNVSDVKLKIEDTMNNNSPEYDNPSHHNKSDFKQQIRTLNISAPMIHSNKQHNDTKPTQKTESDPTLDESLAPKNTTNMTNSFNFNCSIHIQGKFVDNKECRKFYTCIGRLQPVIGTCPPDTVFSDINKQCTKNLSHCVRNNQFRCLLEGRYNDIFKDNVYYICIRNNTNVFTRYTLKCLRGYHLNKKAVRCEHIVEDMSSESASSVGENSQNNIGNSESTQANEDKLDEGNKK